MTSPPPPPPTTCDDFELLLDMRAHGALDAADAPRLDAHLAGCAACRAYRDRTAAVARALAASTPSPALVEELSARMRRGLERRRRERWRNVVGIPVTTALLLGAGVILGFLPAHLLWRAAIGAPALMAFFALAHYLGERRLRRFCAQTDVVAAYRKQLEDGIKIWRINVPISLLVAAIQIPTLLRLREWDGVDPSVRWSVFMSLFIFGTSLWAGVAFIVGARRARRELAGLR